VLNAFIHPLKSEHNLESFLKVGPGKFDNVDFGQCV
jgi:hypothetical protein